MVEKIAGVARLIATLLAIVAAIVPIAAFNVPLALVVLGLIAGLKYGPDSMVSLLLVVLALPLVGAALAHIPAIGAQLNAIAGNVEIAAASIAATVIAMRLYNNSRNDVMDLAGSAGGTTAAAKA